MPRLLILSAFWLCANVNAQSFTENFSSASRRDSGDLIWNFRAGHLHAPLTAYGWDDGLGGSGNREIDVGTGEHGAFDNTTYSRFDNDGDPSNFIIQINTDDYPEGLSVSNFVLDAGYTIKPEGSLPLIIKSLGGITISGTIDCSGDPGEPLGPLGTVSSGGQGRCGGQNGGDGGSSSTAATAGSDSAGSATGGDPGTAGGANGGIGGGGGGSFNFSGATPDDGEDPNTIGANDGATAGTLDSIDPGFGIITLGGGAGGGGGGPSTNGTNDSSGGGGGAGGGIILLMAYGDIQIANSGMVKADGGDGGGGGAAGQDGGGGGGGGGGTIAIFAGGSIINDRVLGVTTDGGAGGTTANIVNGGSHGGAGTPGRIWMTDQDGALAGAGSEPPYANSLVLLGDVLPREGTYTAVSDAIELYTSLPVITAVNLISQTDVNNTVTTEFSTSSEAGFTPSTWIDSSLWAGTNASRFVRFRVTIDIGDRTQLEAQLQNLNFTYDRLFQTRFDFKGGCGLVRDSDLNKNSHGPLAIAILLLPLLIAFILRRKLPTEAATEVGNP